MARRTFSYPISLAIVVATLIALTGGFIAYWNYRTGVDNTRHLAGRLFDQIARETKSQTESFLSHAPPAAQALVGMAEREPPAEAAILQRCLTLLRANPAFKWVSYSDSQGTFLGAYREGNVVRVSTSRITDGRTVADEHEVLPDGSWKPFKHQDDSKYDPRTRLFYTAAATATGGVWTPPYVFNENVPGVTYAHALRGSGGVVGVFTIDFDLARLSVLARELQFSMNGRVVVTTQDGVVIAHPYESITKGTELMKTTELKDPAVKAILAAPPGTHSLQLAGEPFLARTVPIEATGWNVIVYAPESDFTAVMRKRVFTSLLISLIAMLLAVAVAWRIARRVSGPLTTLSAEMVKVGGLHLDGTTTSSSMFREIDMMNTALDKMKGGLRSFSRYVPRDLVRTLLKSGHTADLSGEVRELTIYFSDLAGFTSLSETRAPDELVQFLSQYFDDMSRIIMTEEGTVDKYMGDGIMAFWGAPLDVKNHAAKACTAALRCQKRVRELLAEQGVLLTTRIGMATGKVLVGNIGSTERINYTVMGDTANLASRLEGLNKQYGTDSMISEETYEQAKEFVVARPVDIVAVKGKKQGVRVFELLALASDNNAEAVAIADASTRALAAYLEQRFTEAAAAWDEVLAKRPDDKAAQIMKDRALVYAASPPERWSGVSIATEK